MRATIDQAGRVVIPKRLRDELGFRPGEVELTSDERASASSRWRGNDLTSATGD
ncbi:MAG TPA: AbrB/MazE/SpoVT family DNA-binding domain-containing protein [Solirubrobacteraceae bacterium]|nr:AbrB/MazE/SpoVT family DNA-binding domain-containing protein [Solirubrobacteraceae bacterium]